MTLTDDIFVFRRQMEWGFITTSLQIRTQEIGEVLDQDNLPHSNFPFHVKHCSLFYLTYAVKHPTQSLEFVV